ncbi:NUDIX hydrolase [Bacillus atrophaeus]|uniref:NUDIX hydrolase n=1 Tax=Bacillus atrophaeus TaxID=1452 RepID=UPI003527FDE9
MKTQGAFVVVCNKEQGILLVKRKDVPLWDLPGGRAEQDETVEECAIRETYEETGYIIDISYKIGEYERPKFHDVQHIVNGRITGGKALKHGTETANTKWFHPHRLPALMIPNRKEQINDFTSKAMNLKKVLPDHSVLATLDLFRKKITRSNVSSRF